MSFFQYLGAIANKHWTAATVDKPIVKTATPMAELTQRSLVELDGVPFILANAEGSLFRDISGNHTISAVGTLTALNTNFFRAYLSKDEGSFLHLAVNPFKPSSILECRIYQRYNEIIPTYMNRVEQVASLGPNAEVDESENWEFWLLDNPDPNVGGMIGCPIMQGKNEDGPLQYTRTWVANNGRISPIETTETIVDANGDTSYAKHTMMHYSRQLNDDKLEYLLVSCVECEGLACVTMWLGLDLDPGNMKVFAVSVG